MLSKEVAVYDEYGNIKSHKLSTVEARKITGTDHVYWRDLQDKPLIVPAGNSPFRNCLLWLAKRAFDDALMCGDRAHTIAQDNALSEEEWSSLFEYAVTQGSPSRSLVMKRWAEEK